ncbi:Transmembrane protein [Spathaspora sp. JA1]|nr:Transmembrane protein [Spathaspora sp. JA1]
MVFKFTIDDVLNRYIPANRLNRLPYPVSRFLGAHTPTPRHDYLIWLEILVSSFCGIALIEGVFKSHTVFTSHHAPIIIASYGATAILCFNASQAPLAQPRNILVGHFISSLIGVCIQKLFSLSEGGRNHYWASGALSVGVASTAMSILNCVHPPAGASALLPSIDESIQDMSWWYLPAHLVSSVLIICVALIFGNIFRKYPVYWWTPAPVGKPKPPQEEEKLLPDLERTITEQVQASVSRVMTAKSEGGGAPHTEGGIMVVPGIRTITITVDNVMVPEEIDFDEIDNNWLEGLQSRLRLLNDE